MQVGTPAGRPTDDRDDSLRRTDENRPVVDGPRRAL
jgi:hypothetical protein